MVGAFAFGKRYYDSDVKVQRDVQGDFLLTVWPKAIIYVPVVVTDVKQVCVQVGKGKKHGRNRKNNRMDSTFAEVSCPV